uniref:Uncharacterized protein n=1 Tax=Fagus sylvatica TaxID=28930 RepID=A0A2N9H3E2_FAGSY
MSLSTMRGLSVFISNIRNCTNKEQERLRVDKELSNVRTRFKNEKIRIRCNSCVFFRYWEPTYEDSLNLIARVPVVAAYVYRRIYKDGQIVPLDDSLDYGANFSHMLGFDSPKMLELMRLYEAAARLEEMKKSVEAKMALRQSNLNPERPDSGFLRTLDSSIKRNTAVIKKLKQINEEQREGLMEELRSVNLSKFVSEAVTAICDAKLRSSDIQAAVQVIFCAKFLRL